MENLFAWARQQYPASRHLDYANEMVKLDSDRMESPPDMTRYPETRGLPDRLRTEREGFLDGCGGNELMLAFQYTWSFFCSRRLNTRYIGTGIRANRCSEVFFRDSREGGPLFGKNLDDIRRPASLEQFPPPAGPDGKRCRRVWTDSGSVLCDEEPKEMFPLDVWELMPPGTAVRDTVEFLRRYVEFWGPCSCIVVDEKLDSVVIEKSNCRMEHRFSDDGTAAITACSFLLPGMKAFRDERHRLSLKLRGWDETAPDAVYWRGCEARHHRLLKLTSEANTRGATLDDVGRILLDTDVPFPDRICLEGQRGHPDDVEGNWTLTSTATVLEGPNRRTLFWRVDGDTPCHRTKPILIPGKGLKIRSKRGQRKG